MDQFIKMNAFGKVYRDLQSCRINRDIDACGNESLERNHDKSCRREVSYE